MYALGRKPTGPAESSGTTYLAVVRLTPSHVPCASREHDDMSGLEREDEEERGPARAGGLRPSPARGAAWTTRRREQPGRTGTQLLGLPQRHRAFVHQPG